MIKVVRIPKLGLLFALVFLFVAISKCKNNRQDHRKRTDQMEDARADRVNPTQNEIEAPLAQNQYVPKQFDVPRKAKARFGDKTYSLLDFGTVKWLASDLDYPVGQGTRYGNRGSLFGGNTRLYSCRECELACNAIGMYMPSITDWRDLLINTAGNDDSQYSPQGFNQHIAYERLTTRDGLSFDVDLVGFGFIRKDGVLTFSGKGTEVSFWTATRDFEGLPHIVKFDQRDISVRFYRQPDTELYKHACRCVNKTRQKDFYEIDNSELRI